MPIAETMEGIQSLYLAGKFEKVRLKLALLFLLLSLHLQFDLSNFSAQQVEECYNYAKSKDYVLPTIY